MYTATGDQQVHANNSAFNTDALVNAGAFTPIVDYDFLEIIPPPPPAPPATQVINYRTGGGAGLIVRQLEILYDAAGNVDTITRTV